jgi:hypothetical protein
MASAPIHRVPPQGIPTPIHSPHHWSTNLGNHHRCSPPPQRQHCLSPIRTRGWQTWPPWPHRQRCCLCHSLGKPLHATSQSWSHCEEDVLLAAAQITEVHHREHQERLGVWRKSNNVNMAIKQQLIGAAEPMFLRALMHHQTGFASITTRALIVHLLTSYGRITPIESSLPTTSVITKPMTQLC